MSSLNPPNMPARRLLSQKQSVAYGVVAAALFLASSSAPTPIYHLYHEMFHLTPLTMTAIFATYAFGLLAALLTIGSLSDFVGRRPVILAALLLNLGAMTLFLTADSAQSLILARLVQGLAAGAATTTIGAAILDFNREKGPLLNSVSPFLGMTAGALASGTLVSFAPAPMVLIYVVLFAITLLLLAFLPWLPEGASGKQGAIASLVPHVAVPANARPMMIRITPVNIASWALGGFYLSLMPSLVRDATGLSSPIVGALVVSLLTLTATATVIMLRARSGHSTLAIGSWSLVTGMAITLAGVYLHSVSALLAGAVFTGIAFGACFSGAMRIVLPLVRPDERAGMLSAFYVQSYLSFSLPAMAVGIAASHVGLSAAAYIYGVVIILMASFSIVAIRRPAV